MEGRVRACLFSDNLYDISYANNLTLRFSFFFHFTIEGIYTFEDDFCLPPVHVFVFSMASVIILAFFVCLFVFNGFH